MRCLRQTSQKGYKGAICAECMPDERKVEGIGKLMSSTNIQAPTFSRCSPCIVAERQGDEDAFLRSVGGPSPQEVLRSIAASHAWFLRLARASLDDKLAAHYEPKRRQDINTSERGSAHSLANHDPMGAMLLNNLG